MTALGKVLAFFNLLFALLTGGFVVEVYLTRTNWKIAYDQVIKERNLAQNALTAEKAISTRQAEVASKGLEELKGEIAREQRINVGLQENLKTAKDEKEAAIARMNTELANASAVSRELERLNTERGQMQVQLREKDARMLAIQKENNRLSAVATFQEIRANSTDREIEQLKVDRAKLVRQIEQTNEQIRQLGGVAQGVPKADTPRIPTVETSGKIKYVEENLAQITLGSDHGLEVGHVLQVWRTDPVPLFLGTLTIRSLETRRAVGNFQPVKRNMTVQVGDSVGTKIQ